MNEKDDEQMLQRMVELERKLDRLTQFLANNIQQQAAFGQAGSADAMRFAIAEEDTVRSTVDLSLSVHKALKTYLLSHPVHKKIGPFLQYLVVKKLGPEYIKSVNL